MEPQIIADRYTLKEIVGEGSYSIVFSGYDMQKKRPVAIKELKSNGLTREEANEAQQLFFNEINILKGLKHRVIPEVFDFFLFEGRHYMVMEWVEGKNFLSVLENKGALPQYKALDYMGQIAGALIYLQEQGRGVIYRDIKPSNIIVNKDGQVKLIDFGTARFYSRKKEKDTHVLGTPGYAPPEAFAGEQTNFSSDVYSMGATFYHLTTGKEPYQFKFKFPDASKFNPNLTLNFTSLLRRCLKPRDERIPNAYELRNRIYETQGSLFGGSGWPKIEESFGNVSVKINTPFGCYFIIIFLTLLYFLYGVFMKVFDSIGNSVNFLHFIFISALIIWLFYGAIKYISKFFIKKATNLHIIYLSMLIYILFLAILILLVGFDFV